jgi:aldose 1-epimerase
MVCGIVLRRLAVKISRKTFGVLHNGKKVRLFTLKAGGLALSVSTLGGTWVSLEMPSRRGGRDDVLLGYAALDGYLHNNPYLGATIGRFANRIGNARFTLDGQDYTLFKNDGEHSLHGGRRGFDRLLWKAGAYREKDGVFLRLELESPGGDEGYPGNLRAEVTYGVTKANQILAEYRAVADKRCPVNLTNHAYFNLAGEGKGDILSHEVRLYASSYVEVDSSLIPTGRLVPVKGTPFDFTRPKPIGRDIAAAGGYDHCYALDGGAQELKPCAEVSETESGRSMKVFTTQPGLQFYTGNSLAGIPGKIGSVYHKHGGFCLETQYFPDSPNRPAFPDAVFGPDRVYHEKSLFSFDW